MILIPNLGEENMEYLHSYCYICFQCLCRNIVWSCCFATLDLSDDHADFFSCWCANIDWEVRGCCFDVGWVQWGWSIQEFLEVIYSPVLLFFNVSDYLALLAFHWSYWFTIISSELLCCIIQLSHVSLSFSLFRRRCQILHIFTFVDSDAPLHPLVYFCVFSLCLGFLFSCSAGIDCFLLVPPFLNLIQYINSDPLLAVVLLVA
ncbi:unnamed protein product [Schistosoma mattheei]|uniref:Uncharacterized protein n=1 Tax=Schistosoma mattheei TaxID=31246 RepID=A0A3P8G4T6_9TREM|nr:unnamed protein product [Schistosoma mattheei]